MWNLSHWLPEQHRPLRQRLNHRPPRRPLYRSDQQTNGYCLSEIGIHDVVAHVDTISSKCVVVVSTVQMNFLLCWFYDITPFYPYVMQYCTGSDILLAWFGDVLSTPWRQANLRFKIPNVCSTITLVLHSDALNLCWGTVEGLRKGVIRYLLHG